MTSDRPTREDATAQGAKAVAYWTAQGAINVGCVVFQVGADRGTYEGWSYRLRGMCPRKGVPLEWVPGADRKWVELQRRRA